VAVAVYASWDMQRRGRTGWLYGLGLFLGVLGLIAWVIGRAKYPVQVEQSPGADDDSVPAHRSVNEQN
jgi:hypothetical protein